MNNSPYSLYTLNQIASASREDIMLQLMEGALSRVRYARTLWSEGQKGEARKRRIQALDIINYLDETLDRDSGGEIVDQMEALYAYMQRVLNNIAITEDFGQLESVESIMETLYAGWKDAVTEYKKNKSLSGQADRDHRAAQISA